MAGRRPDKLEESLIEYEEREMSFAENWYDSEENVFNDDDTQDLLDGMPDYSKLGDL